MAVKNHFLKSLSLIGITLLLLSCRGTNPKIRAPQQFDPRFPYKEHNLTVISDKLHHEAGLIGGMAGKAARQPQVALESAIKSYKGVSDKNPYERATPYYRDEYNRDVLGRVGERLMEPVDSSQMQYPSAIRAAHLVEGDDIDLSKEAVLYKKHLDEVSGMILAAEELMRNNQFDAALGKINQALDRDPGSEAARAVYSQIVRAQERHRYEGELEVKQEAAAAEQQKEDDEKMRIERMKKARMIEEYAHRIAKSLEMKDYDEAKRLGNLIRQIDPENPYGQEVADEVDLVIFKRSLDPRILSNNILMEDLILEHLQRFQEYSDTGLHDLARRELQKITFLESLRNR